MEQGSLTFTLYLYHLGAETGVWNKVVLPLPFTFIIGVHRHGYGER